MKYIFMYLMIASSQKLPVPKSTFEKKNQIKPSLGIKPGKTRYSYTEGQSAFF